jgi:hypothetical protein
VVTWLISRSKFDYAACQHNSGPCMHACTCCMLQHWRWPPSLAALFRQHLHMYHKHNFKVHMHYQPSCTHANRWGNHQGPGAARLQCVHPALSSYVHNTRNRHTCATNICTAIAASHATLHTLAPQLTHCFRHQSPIRYRHRHVQ